MAKRFAILALVAAFCLLGSAATMAQVSSTGTLIGTVTDQTGAVIAGADLKVRDEATGAVIESKTGPSGQFTVANLKPGTYTVTVTMQGFKAAEFRNVKIIVGQIYDLQAKMEVGAVESTVVVEAGAEVLETASTTIGSTITGKSITHLPLTSRDALDLALLMPGAATTGRARQSSFMGLPKGAINITIDGINAQDNLLKSNDGFFTMIRPRVESMEEFSISTAGQGAEQSSEGAVQIRFETRRGGNEYHGGVWWQHRNDFFNANYWFSNRDGIPRQRQRLNQWGGRVGGPVWKERLFFFAAIETYRNPQSQARTRTILSQDSLAGRFTYGVTSIPGTLPAWVTCAASSPRRPTGGAVCTADLFAMGTALGFPVTTDATTMDYLNTIETARTAPGVGVNPVTSTWLDNISFNNPGGATRRFPDLRLDYNITKNIQWTGIYHYNFFTATPDFLNNLDRTYPVAPFDSVFGSQMSNRNEWVTAVRWNLSSTMSNEVRWGLQTAPTSFFPDQLLAAYPSISNNLGTINTRPVFPSISNPLPTFNVQARNTALSQLIETFTWAKGKHSVSLGGTWTRVSHRGYFASRAVNSINIGLPGAAQTSGGSSISGLFNTTNLPGISTADQGNARNNYAMLVGMVSSYTGTVSVDENTRQFVAGSPLMQRTRQDEFGVYGQDSWRVHSTLTFNYGLRWEYQGAPFNSNDVAFSLVGGAAGVFGPSGSDLSAVFSPGTLPNSPTSYQLNGVDRPWYDKDLNNFAPNVGLAWSPNFDTKLFNTFFGGPGKTVLRSSYSITFTREGIANYTAIGYANPGPDGSILGQPVTQTQPCPAPPFGGAGGTYPAGCATVNNILNGSAQFLALSPSSFPTSAFEIRANSGQSVNAFADNLKIPLVHNWSFSIQREINPNLVVEVRYVGNHGSGLWRQVDVNEVNIFENGFLAEFGIAKQNLAICRATPGCTLRFSNQGLPGQQNVPILTGAFTGSQTGSQTSANFSSGTLIGWLDANAAGTFAALLSGNLASGGVAQTFGFLCNMVGSPALAQAGSTSNPCGTTPITGAGFPVNFWQVNPHARSGAFLMNNNTHSTYNGLVVEVRQRNFRGLQFNANYTFSKALNNYFGDSSASFTSFTTMRDPGYDKSFSPWDLRHVFKFNGLYSLPFGPGRKWSSQYGVVNRIIEGWEIGAVQIWQSGRLFLLNSGGSNNTVNQNDPGVELLGINRDQLQSMLSIRKLPTGQVFWFPASLIASNGTANSTFIRPCSTAGQLCQRVFLTGPRHFRTNVNIAKRTKIYENYEIEFRASFLNAWNNINFFFPGSETTSVPTASITGTSFGQVTNAYRDVSTTDDNGGRIIEFQIRINF